MENKMHKKHFSFFFLICFCTFQKLTKTMYFNTGFLFLRCKIHTDIKQKKTKIKTCGNHKYWKIFFSLIFFKWAGPTRPNNMGWAQPVWTVLFTVHMLHEQWRRDRDDKGCREGWPVVASRRCCWRWWLQRCCWGHDGARLASSYLLCRGESLCFSCSFSFFLLLDELLLLVAIERRRNGGAAGL